MQVKDVMSRDVEVVEPQTTLEEAAAKMDALNIGPLPVVEGERVVGMITDRDITVRATAAGRDPTTTTVEDAMTHEVVACFDDQDVTEAARLMEEKQIRRLVVLDRNEKLVGIISLGDVAVGTGDDKLSGEVLERVSEPGIAEL